MKQMLLTAVCLLTFIQCPLAAIIFDGVITETDWGSPLATSSGGPVPGFGAGHEINAIYATGDATNVYIAIAGNVLLGNRILLFIDAKSGGYSSGNFGRIGAPEGIDQFNSGTTFDPGFEPDFCLVIGTNGVNGYFFDLYTLSGVSGSGGGPNNFLGAAGGAGLGGSPANSDITRGFEATISKSTLGYTGGDIQVMAMYISDGGYLSNQFLTRANPGEGNYTEGVVAFGSAMPNPVTISSSLLPVDLTDLRAKYVAGAVHIFWTTAMEYNNSHFDVERFASEKEWMVIGTVSGNNTTSERKDYRFVDQSPMQGHNFYRLRQVDHDGRFEYSVVVSAEYTDDRPLFAIYPNPATDNLYILANDTQSLEWPLDIAIVDASGRMQLQESLNGNKVAVNSLKPGIHVAILKSKEGRLIWRQHFIKQ